MFSVPIIPPDLRHEETIVQAAHALACLEKTIFSIFDSIDNRIVKNQGKLQIINHRIQRAKERLVGSNEAQGLVGSKKSITIYAPPRFPGTQILRENISSTFTSMASFPHERPEKDSEHYFEIKSRLDPSNALNEKLIFFHVRSIPEWHSCKEFAVSKIGTSLGPMPEEIECITSTLRFNTNDFVYDSGITSSTDSWKQAKLFKKDRYQFNQAQSAVHVQQLPPAPYSLTHHKDHKATRTLHYTPRLHDLPNIDLPVDLPDLPGIADDIQFVAQDQQRIAPSLLIEDLPDLDELEKKQQLQTAKDNKSGSAEGLPEALKPPKEALISDLYIPLPPPPPSAPPPPPPPPQIPKLSEHQPSSSEPSTDMRSDLMAAIRKAGGIERARLRPAAPINAIANPESDGVDRTLNSSEKPSSSSGGGLMAELHNKLQLRRKGISGAKDKEGEEKQIGQTSSNPLLSHLSSLIPQTKIKSRFEQEDDADDWVD